MLRAGQERLGCLECPLSSCADINNGISGAVGNLSQEPATKVAKRRTMSEKKDLRPRRSLGEPYTIVKERLSGTSTDLTSFFFHRGANLYVFSYEKEGVRRHTFIDTGDSRYRNQILSILAENDINPTTIERIIMTHRHPDPFSLAALLFKESRARILVHPRLKSFI